MDRVHAAYRSTLAAVPERSGLRLQQEASLPHGVAR